MPTHHPDSLYGMARELMLSRCRSLLENLHRMLGEAENPGVAAAEYELMLKDFFGLKTLEFPELRSDLARNGRERTYRIPVSGNPCPGGETAPGNRQSRARVES